MILSADPAALLALLVLVGYLAAAAKAAPAQRWPTQVLLASWVMHGVLLLIDAAVVGADAGTGLRIGFAPALSFTVWLVVAVYEVESRFVPLSSARRVLAVCGAAAVLLAWLYPGDVRAVAHTRWAPMHWALGLASYGLFGAAVLHGLLLDTAERRMRQKSAGSGALGMPLLKLERLTFRFVDAGFVVLTLALMLGVSSGPWRWDHKTVLSLLGWATFAALLVGRHGRGWRGRQATRWLYAGALLLLLAYVGTRFVLEVVLHRTTT